MKKKDAILAAICGLSVGWIAVDFFGEKGLPFFIIFPILSIIGLWICELIGKKYLFVKQAGKFGLAGAFADVVDIKIFQLLFLFAPYSLLFKFISFIAGTFVKYFSDKYWTFEKNDKLGMHKEMAKFFVVAITGSLLNVASFYFFGKINIGIPQRLWVELSIILAAIVSGVWNFLGYKFIVFKK